MLEIPKKREHISFYEDKHLYINEQTKERYTSGTSFVGLFHEKFVAEDVACKLITTNPKYAEKYKGYSLVDAIRMLTAEWKEAGAMGTRVHNLLERHLLGQQIITDDLPPAYKVRYQSLIDAYERLDLRGDYPEEDGWVFEPEYIVFSDEFKLAGQSDLIIFNHNEKKFVVKDYKTNKKGIDRNSYKDKRMFEPIYHLQDCKMNHYSLQLSLYAYFLEKELGYTCADLELLWVDTNDKRTINIERIYANYLKEEIERMLEHFASAK